ncbi:MAG: hypothetical protein AAFQ98_23425 [Bacteroidota bacterium]
MNEARHLWLEKGYLLFALEGPGGIRVSRMAKELARNKSAFYHYFATTEIFISHLLDHHLVQAKGMSAQMLQCQHLDDLVETMIAHKTDLLFNRQLRVHRHHAEFETYFTQTNSFVGDSIMPVWSKIIDLENNPALARLVLQLSVENFFLKATQEAFQPDWLKEYFLNVRALVREFKASYPGQ